MIENSTGMIENSTGMIEESTGMIPETDTEYPSRGRRKRSRERGKDSKPRNFSLHIMKNLPQFRDKPHEEIRQYILDKKGVDIGSNFNWNKTLIWIVIGLAIVAGSIGVWNLWQQRQEKTEDESC